MFKLLDALITCGFTYNTKPCFRQVTIRTTLFLQLLAQENSKYSQSE